MFRKGDRLIPFIQPRCYALIVKKTNFRNDSEQHVHRFNFDLPVHFPHLASIKSDAKVVIQLSPPRRQGQII